jgi:hypothetical protein
VFPVLSSYWLYGCFANTLIKDLDDMNLIMIIMITVIRVNSNNNYTNAVYECFLKKFKELLI